MTVIPAPRSLCLLRLSALGDATHAVALVRALQRAWPHLPITWIIGKGEAKLLEGLDGVEFIVFDKKAGLAGYRDLRRKLAGRRFDVLLNLQLALRAGLVSTLVHAERRIGYDRARSKEGHSLFINERIRPADTTCSMPSCSSCDHSGWRLRRSSGGCRFRTRPMPGPVSNCPAIRRPC
jgi:heptosyltransferase I